MASNNKRVATKHIRDGIKAKYKKLSFCEICGTDDLLELHHYSTVSLLLKDYAERNSIPISTDEEVLAMRDDFYKIHSKELIEDTVTLCKEHHALLHTTYGSAPPLHTAVKQPGWVTRKRDALGIVDESFLHNNIETKEDKKIHIIESKQPKKLPTTIDTSGLAMYQTLLIPLGEFKV